MAYMYPMIEIPKKYTPERIKQINEAARRASNEMEQAHPGLLEDFHQFVANKHSHSAPVTPSPGNKPTKPRPSSF